MAKLSKFTRNILNVTAALRTCYRLHLEIVQASAPDTHWVQFVDLATHVGRANEWAIAAAVLAGALDEALERCPEDLLLGCIGSSLVMQQWHMDLHSVPQHWSTDEQWDRLAYWDDDRDAQEHFDAARNWYAESNFDRTHEHALNRVMNRCRIGDWSHNQHVVRQWFDAVIAREEDPLAPTAMARLSLLD